MKAVIYSGAFKKDYKRQMKRGKDEAKLTEVIRILAHHLEHPARHRPHKLTGNWVGRWELHIEPDWLLIYHYDDDTIILDRTGTHADLFE